MGRLGMKTLDPSDWAYRGNYDNGNDSEDSSVAHGFNYHQGPEWVWVMGYFLRAYMYFENMEAQGDVGKKKELLHTIQSSLFPHKAHLLNSALSPYAGLPELTNADGAYCHGSCPTQAWSMACLQEAVADYAKL